jgi:hypothetical protein
MSVFTLFGFRSTDKERHSIVSTTVDHFMVLTKLSNDDWVKVMKYKIAAFFSCYAGQAIPTPPWKEGATDDKPGYLFGGSAGRWMRKLLWSSTALGKAEFITTILYSKSGMPRVDKDVVSSKEQATVDKLTAQQGPDAPAARRLLLNWGDVPEEPFPVQLTLSRGSVETELRRTVREVFRGHKMTDARRTRAFFPSTSANYINSRSQAGAVGFILNHETLLNDLRAPGGLVKVAKVGEHDRDTLTGEPADEEREPEPEDSNPLYTADTSALESAFGTLLDRMLALAMTEQPIVKPVGLVEPLKVRVITKGPPLTYTVLKSLQKFMHDTLRRQKTFQLIGTPATEATVLDLLGRKLGSDEVFLSGDYTGATDNLKSWVSETIADEISAVCELTENERELFIRSLTKHVFEGEDGTHYQQTTGQLMGSVTSFPVLCIANAALVRWAMEVAEKKTKKLRDCAMGVNGDDVAAKSHHSIYRIWSRITGFAGLEESIGKTYVSREFVNINSLSFLYGIDPVHLTEEEEEKGVVKVGTHLVEVESRLYQTWLKDPSGPAPSKMTNRACPYTVVPYINMGLMMGLDRTMQVKNGELVKAGFEVLDDPRADLSSKAEWLVEHSPKDVVEAVYTEFLRTHKTMLDGTHLPWFLPKWIGGIGLPVLNENNRISELDLRIAMRIILGWNKGPKSRPIQIGMGQSAWQVRKLAKAGLPEYLPTVKGSEAYEAGEELLGYKSIDLLFDSDVDLDSLKTAVDRKRGVGAAIRHNQNLWRPGKSALPPAADLSLLVSEPMSEGLRVGILDSVQRTAEKRTLKFPTELVTRFTYKERLRERDRLRAIGATLD